MHCRRLDALAVLLFASSCYPTFAPPVRALHQGMPGRLPAGAIELGATVGGVTIPQVVVPHMAMAFNDLVALEAGGNFNSIEWAMGWVGTRLTLGTARGNRFRWVSDLELGIGGGMGGVISGGHLKGLTAFGGYGGLGVGLQVDWFGVYLRGRVDGSEGRQLPLTLWPTAMIGVEARRGRVSFGLGGGYAGYWTEQDHLTSGLFYQALVVVTLPDAARPGAGHRP